MATPDIRRAVTWLKANLPDLEALAVAQEGKESMRLEMEGIRAEISTLRAQRDSAKEILAADLRAADEARAKRAEAAAKAEKMAASRLEDLQRQQQALEAQNDVIRAKLAAQGQEHAQRIEEHQMAVNAAKAEVIRAQDQLAKTHGKIKALHEHLAGVQGP